jgi:hypothetical protein
MENTPEIEPKERERAALFDEATRIVRNAEARSTGLSVEEDSRVLELMRRARGLEEEIGQLRRREHKRDPTQKGNEDQP